MSLKIGDRVKVTSDVFSPKVPVGSLGTVSEMEDEQHLYVILDDYPDPLAQVFGVDGWAFLGTEVERV